MTRPIDGKVTMEMDAGDKSKSNHRRFCNYNGFFTTRVEGIGAERLETACGVWPVHCFGVDVVHPKVRECIMNRLNNNKPIHFNETEGRPKVMDVIGMMSVLTTVVMRRTREL